MRKSINKYSYVYDENGVAISCILTIERPTDKKQLDFIIDALDVPKVSAHIWCMNIKKLSSGRQHIYAMTNPRHGVQLNISRFLMQPAKGFHVEYLDGNGQNVSRSNLLVVVNKGKYV